MAKWPKWPKAYGKPAVGNFRVVSNSNKKTIEVSVKRNKTSCSKR